MQLFKFDANNTEGKYGTAFVADGIELKKGDKILATDITDLYDVDVNDPQADHYLIYNASTGMWENQEVHGGTSTDECERFYGYDHPTITADSFPDVLKNDAAFSFAYLDENGVLYGNTYYDSYTVFVPSEDFPPHANIYNQEINGIETQKTYFNVRNTMGFLDKDNYIYIRSKYEGSTSRTLPKAYYAFSRTKKGIDFTVYATLGAETGNEIKTSIAYIREDTTIWALGSFFYYDNGTHFQYEESQIGATYLNDPTGFVKIYTNDFGYSFLFIKTDGSLWAIGRNLYAQLGDGSPYPYTIYELTMVDPGPWETIYMDDFTSYGIKSDGTLWLCGYGADQKNVWEQLGTDTDWEYINRRCVRKTDGTWWYLYRDVVYPIENSERWKDIRYVHYDDSYYTDTKLFIDKDTNEVYFTGFNKIGGGDSADPITPYKEYNENIIEPEPIPDLRVGYVYIDERYDVTGEDGTKERPFTSLNNFFTFMKDKCRIIPKGTTIRVICLSDITMYDERINLSFYEGDRIVIDLNGNRLVLNPRYTVTPIYDAASGEAYFIHNISEPTIYITEGKTIYFDNLKIAFYPQCDQISYQYETTMARSAGLHTIALINGSLYGTGEKIYLDLQNDTSPDEPYQYKFDVACAYDDIEYIDMSPFHTMIIRRDGTMYGQGLGENYQLGNGITDFIEHFEQTIELESKVWIKVACGYNHTIAIANDNTIWGTGLNNKGQLGIPDMESKKFFTIIGTENDDNWKEVSCGEDFTIAIKDDGTMWATGVNDKYQLGIPGDTDTKYEFTRTGTDDDWDKIFCGKDYAIAIKQDGRVFVTGNNSNGQLGTGNTRKAEGFTWIELPEPAFEVACGDTHACILTIDGNLYMSGRNDYGQFGTNNRLKTTHFYKIDRNEAHGMLSVAAGSNTSFSINMNGSLYACGNNTYGQCGYGDHRNQKTFTYTVGGTQYYDYLINDPLIIEDEVTIAGLRIEGGGRVHFTNVDPSVYGADPQECIGHLPEGVYDSNYEILVKITVNKVPVHVTEMSYADCNECTLPNMSLIDKGSTVIYKNTTEINDIQVMKGGCLIVDNEDTTIPVSIGQITINNADVYINDAKYTI